MADNRDNKPLDQNKRKIKKARERSAGAPLAFGRSEKLHDRQRSLADGRTPAGKSPAQQSSAARRSRLSQVAEGQRSSYARQISDKTKRNLFNEKGNKTLFLKQKENIHNDVKTT